MNIRTYIQNNWKNCIRTKNRASNSIAVPYPYTAPCSNGIFDDLYYWDTFFINEGLLLEKNFEQAKNNILDISYLISKYGFMPNANREDMLNRSQPPLFISMVYSYYLKTKDIKIINDTILSMETEIKWWIKNRSFVFEDKTLFYYSSHANEEFYNSFYKEYISRISDNKDKTISPVDIAKNALGECESGWDFSPRFSQNILSFFPIDLNSIMYFNLVTFVNLAKIVNKEIGEKYLGIADDIRSFCISNCKDKHGILNDYNFKYKKMSTVVSMASFYPYFFGLYNDSTSFVYLYDTLNMKYGLPATSSLSDKLYQWSFPNVWPPLVFIALKGAINLNLKTIAQEISKKYIYSVKKTFKETNRLWEKYDCLTGGKSSKNEYNETEMMGWSAATYVYCDEILKGNI